MKIRLISKIKKVRTYLYRLKCKTTIINEAASVGDALKVNYKSHVTANTHLGKNVNFNGIIISGNGRVQIGDNFHSGSDCLIISQNHNFDTGDAIPYGEGSYISKDVIIEDNVWIGSRVIILPGVSIGEGAIIQAGAVVSKDIPECAIAGGNPAAVFKYRDKEHYYKLRDQKSFW